MVSNHGFTVEQEKVSLGRQVAISSLSVFFSKKGLTAEHCSLCVRE